MNTYHSIVVTGRNAHALHEARSLALSMFQCVSPVSTPDPYHGMQSFWVAPDGAPDGHPDARNWDKRRETFSEFLRSQRGQDGECLLTWVRVSYPGNSPDPAVVPQNAFDGGF